MFMSHDEFTKLFQYMVKIDAKLDAQFEHMATRDDINTILNRFDSIEKQLEIDDDERLVMGHQLERLDQWVHGMAKKIGYKLPA